MALIVTPRRLYNVSAKMKRAAGIIFGLIAPLAVAWFIISRDRLDGGDSLESTTIASLVVHESFKAPLAGFSAHVGRLPTTEEGLAALIRCPPSCEKRWKGPYITAEAVPLDPWESAYQYRAPGVHNLTGYDLWSLGPDRIQSDDDIGNWK